MEGSEVTAKPSSVEKKRKKSAWICAEPSSCRQPRLELHPPAPTLGPTGCHWVPLGVTGCHWVPLGATAFWA